MKRHSEDYYSDILFSLQYSIKSLEGNGEAFNTFEDKVGFHLRQLEMDVQDLRLFYDNLQQE